MLEMPILNVYRQLGTPIINSNPGQQFEESTSKQDGFSRHMSKIQAQPNEGDGGEAGEPQDTVLTKEANQPIPGSNSMELKLALLDHSTRREEDLPVDDDLPITKVLLPAPPETTEMPPVDSMPEKYGQSINRTDNPEENYQDETEIPVTGSNSLENALQALNLQAATRPERKTIQVAEMKPGPMYAAADEAALTEEAETKVKVKNGDSPLSRDPGNKGQAGEKTGNQQNKNVEGGQENKPRGDAGEVKKMIDFEAHRMKASRLTTTVKTENLQPGSSAPSWQEDLQTGEIKPAKADSIFQEQLRTPVNPKEIIEQMVEKISLIQSKKVSELTLDLKPDYLGKMTIKLAMEEGVLTARFLTDNPQVKNLLESNLSTLRQQLESQGIKVEKTEVNVQLNNGGLFDGSEGQPQDRWQYQGNNTQGWDYGPNYVYEDESFEGATEGSLGYAETDLNDETRMNFLV